MTIALCIYLVRLEYLLHLNNVSKLSSEKQRANAISGNLHVRHQVNETVSASTGVQTEDLNLHPRIILNVAR